MRKSHSTIINETVTNAADIMEAKAEYLILVSEQFFAKSDNQRGEEYRKEANKIREAVAVIRDRAGCWA